MKFCVVLSIASLALPMATGLSATARGELLRDALGVKFKNFDRGIFPMLDWKYCRGMSWESALLELNITLEALVDGCNIYCPDPNAPDLHFRCMNDHTFHGSYQQWADMTGARSSLGLPVFFLLFTVLEGAFFAACLPSWIPYTVGVMLLNVVVGVVAETLESGIDCPWLAWHFHKSVSTADDYLSREEWDSFIGVGINSSAFCGCNPAPPVRARTCGDGSPDGGPGCQWTFDELAQPFKLSSMSPEAVIAKHHEDWSPSEAVLKGNTTSNDHKATKISADALWTSRCNLIRDAWVLNLDPLYILLIFLPTLLFESAGDERAQPNELSSSHHPVLATFPLPWTAFGIDVGILRKQFGQIVLLAGPGLVLSSVVTGVLVWASATYWSFYVPWLLGVITAATDPVAVVALLKELGASPSLGGLIEGESLLNDGTAVVLYVFVRNAIGYPYDKLPPSWMLPPDPNLWIEFFRVIAQMLVLGVIFGWASGLVTRVLLSSV